MVATQPRKLTFAEYLAYEDDTDRRYELIDGELVALPPESGINDWIAQELFWVLAIAQLAPRQLIRPHTCELQVPVLQSGDAANRYPDLVVLRQEHWELTQKRLTITLEMPPPRLVVEVVSPGKTSRERDYQRKRAQYEATGIPEYWIVDTQQEQITVLCLEEGRYIEETILSPTFGELKLTARQIFDSGLS
ncbi:Uma2 family endonuclease [Oscillatoriales cyanobacterium LEGE 11467]|uniref:Uma2 family endonuclease n=1 Tax=Zarconia navalis LEGE 11467 TaxID=1828826 RepID=A0A928Z5T5_9CYAN|nr:Uma2 family endonuclease [Zarconia navalis]MBE9039652.1 Uma2 family endonuclease [Zarconia navalis LEGE 11467]